MYNINLLGKITITLNDLLIIRFKNIGRVTRLMTKMTCDPPRIRLRLFTPLLTFVGGSHFNGIGAL